MQGHTSTHESVLLAKLVQLRVSIQHTSADKLIKYTEDDGREDGEQDVVKGEGPALLEHLAGERVLKGEL